VFSPPCQPPTLPAVRCSQPIAGGRPGLGRESTGGAIGITVGTVTTFGAGGKAITATINHGTGNLTVTALGTITTSGLGTDRFGNTASGIGATEGHGGDEATVAAQWCRPLQVQGWADAAGGIADLTPKLGVQYLHLSEGAFAETGASGCSLSSGSRGTDSLQPYLGVALAQRFVTDGSAKITPELRLGYAHDLFNARVLTVTR
jgi:hypothetical protein